MSNDYYNAGTLLDRNTLGRAEQVNAILQSIAGGFDKLPSQAPLAEGRVTYYADSGTANTYVVTFSPALTAYTAGLTIFMKVGNTNTGASTINVNGLGVKTIKRYNGDALAAGDLTAGSIVPLTYDGTDFLLVGVHGGLVATVASDAAAAAASASAASSSASSASSSASTASTAATNAGNAETAAEAAQSAAEAAETGAEAAQTAAESAETNAASSASAASTSETNAAASETAAAASESAAATSESNAATSASNASASETNAAASASAASTSETNAAASEAAAATSETNAAASESAAATSETNAAASASAASTSETNAAASETAAAASESAAATSESNAATSETNAANSASAASTSESNAATSEANAAASYDSFDDRYLGAKASDPTLDNDGDALLTGALYWNTGSDEMRVYDGASWVAAYVPTAGLVPDSRTLTAGTGLTGGGDLSANRTFNVTYGTSAGTAAQGNDSRINNGQTAFGWGDWSTGVDKAFIDALNVDAQTLAGFSPGQFIRSDTNDVVSGHTEWQDGYMVRLGNSADMELHHSSGNNFIDLNSGDLFIRDGVTNRVEIRRADGDIETSGTVMALHFYLEDRIFHVGDSDTYIQFHGNDQFRVVTGGAERFEVNDNSTTVANRFVLGAEVQEHEHTLSGTSVTLNPANGTIQTHSLTGTTTYSDGLQNGESITLQIDSNGNSVTWPTMEWVGGSAPTLENDTYNVIVLWHSGGTLYGNFVGVTS